MLRVNIENSSKIDTNIWKATLNPSEVRFLGNCSVNTGNFSIISIPNDKIDIIKDNIISFSPDFVKVINIGITNNLLILTEEKLVTTTLKEEPSEKSFSNGDKEFLDKLPLEIKTLGVEILKEVRKHFNGNLKYFENSGKFIESPDNFWTVKIQPRDQSLRITVRGVPSRFYPLSLLQLKPDMNGYSTFKIKDKREIEEAIKIILNASRK